MKTIVCSAFFLLLTTFPLSAQTSLSGIWVNQMNGDEGYDAETITFTEDGYYYSVMTYLNGEEYGIDPTVTVGIYEFDGSTLSIYALQNDNRQSFPIRALNSSGFQLIDPETGEAAQYRYRGEGVLDHNQSAFILSWVNFRKLGGNWKSSDTVLKVLPNLGIVIIRVPSNPDFFRWGHYSVDGNELKLKDISIDEEVFYTGQITDFGRKDFTIVSDGNEEHYQFQSSLNLDETETMMVNRYMQMNHQTSMSIIDMMDGEQNFIWKWVDEYGNEQY